ncbi:MAG: protein kinase [Pseudomonadota bacterium]
MQPPTLSTDRIGHLRLEGVVGRGGMGVVYRAVDEVLGRAVAVKVLFDLDDEENVARFVREARALARLTHPNVVQVYGLGEVEGLPYFSMEWVDGPSLFEIVQQRGALVVDEAVAYAVQAARGLAAAAAAGVIHRDVKPHNLLLQDDGGIKIVDFGLARIGDKPGPHTAQGVAMGTPHYMAPEQARGDAIDHRADQYALAASLYHLLCGQPPFDADSDVALLLKHQQEAPQPLPAIAPEVTPALWEVIAKALGKDPEQRFADHDSFVDALLDAVEPASNWRTGVRLGAALVGAAALAGVLVVGAPWWMARQSPARDPAMPGAQDGGVSSTTGVATSADATMLVAPQGGDASTAEDAGLDRVARALARVGALEAAARGPALQELSTLRDPRVLAYLVRRLHEGEDGERVAAARALGQLGDQSATDALLPALQSGKLELVLVTIETLATLADLRALEPLQTLARTHPDREVRRRAQAAHQKLFSVEDSPAH